MDVIALHATTPAGAAGVRIAPVVGGALTGFTLADRDVLRPTSAATLAAQGVRGCASYPLVPYSNRIAHAQLAWQQRPHALARNFGDHPHAIHGVGWQRAWTVEDAGPAHATLVLRHAPIGADALAWPFAFTARQHIALAAGVDGAVLTLSLAIASDDAAPFPFGLGWHPFLPHFADTLLQWDATGVWRNDDTQLPIAHVATPPAWRYAAPRAPATGLDNVFTHWRGVARLRSATQGLCTTLTADAACTHLVVYVPAECNFLAIEPVTHMTDAFNRAERGETGTGTRVLGPGAAFSCTMRITATPLP